MPGLELITTICCTLLCVACAIVASKRASECLALRKRVRELELSTADLNSSMENLLDSHKRLRSREGMRELRANRSAKRDSTRAETKAELLQRLGLAGKAGPEFARAQLSIHANDTD